MSKTTPSGNGTPTGSAGANAPYVIFYDPNKPDEARTIINSSPVPREEGKSLPFEITDRVLVSDPEGKAGPISFANNLLFVDHTTILEDPEHGKYAEISVGLNAVNGSEELEKLLTQQGDTPVPVDVTLFLDLTGLMGAAGGIALPGGTVTVPVPGHTKIQLSFATSFLLSFEKFQWTPFEETPLHECEGVDQEAVAELSRRGGTLRLKLKGTTECDDETNLECGSGTAHAKLTLASSSGHISISTRNAGEEMPPVAKGSVSYDESSGEYLFKIPPPEGENDPIDVSIEVPVQPEVVIENRFKKIYREVKKIDASLNSSIIEQADSFIIDSLTHLAEKSEEELKEKASQFLHATTSAAYFQGFTYQTAKGLKNALHLHSKAYDRYMENLFNGVVEIVFLLGSGLTDKITSKLLKGEKEVLEAQLKANTKTLAEAAAESTEVLVKQQKGQAKAAMEQLEGQMKTLRKEASESAGKMQSRIATVTQTRKELAEKAARGEVLESEIKQIDNEIAELGKRADDFQKQVSEIDGKVVEVKTARRELTGELDSIGEDLSRLRNELGESTRKADDLRSSIRQVDSEIDQSRTLIDQKQTGVSQAGEQLESAEGRLKSLGGEKRGAEAQLKALESEQAALDAAVDQGSATSAQMKRLDELPSQRDSIASKLDDLDSEIASQRNTVKGRKGKLAEAEQQVQSARSQLETLESKSGKLNQDLSSAEQAQSGLDKQIQNSQNQRDTLKQKQSDLLDEEGILRDEADNVRYQVDENRKEIQVKETAATEKVQDLKQVETERSALVTKHDLELDELGTEAGNLRNNIQSTDKLTEPLANANTKVEKLDCQLETLDAIRNRPKGMSAEEYVAHLKSKMDRLPGDSTVADRVCEKLKGQTGLNDYKEIVVDIQDKIPGDLPSELRRRIGSNLDRMQKTMGEVVHTVEKDQGLKKVTIQQSLDSIKAEINARGKKLETIANSKELTHVQESALEEIFNSMKDNIEKRAAEIRQAILDVTRSDYKAVEAKHYGDTYFGQACAAIDSGVEGLAGWWNSLLDAGTGYYADWKKEFPRAMAYAEEVVLYGLSIMIELFDRMLKMVQWLLDKLIALTNEPDFAASRLNSTARAQGRDGGNLPSSINSQFFDFSAEMVAGAAKSANLKNVINKPGGKTAIASELKEPFKGAWAKYYEPQWEFGREHMVAMAKGALNSNWLESDSVDATKGRQCTELLQKIVYPLTDYANSFDATSEGGMVSALTIYYTGRWTSQDADVIIDGAGWSASMGLKVGGLVLAFTPYAGFVPPMMTAADRMDWLTAFLRITCSMFFTTPAILGAQFDIIYAYNLAYQGVFEGKDLSDCLAPELNACYDGVLP